LPKEYADNISETNLPAELMPEYTTMEYFLPTPNLQGLPPSIYLFVIDICVPPEELQAIKDSILQAVSIMPPETYIGLVTFGRFVFVHELSFLECSKSFSFKGEAEYTTAQVLEMLGVAAKNDPRGPQATGAIKKFIMPISECEATFTATIEDLQVDPWVVPGDERPHRATGSALSIAVSLLEAAVPGQGGRVLSFIGGPCTFGPGQVVGIKLEEMMRAWIDITKDNELCKHIKKASKFYQSISQRAIKAGVSIDQFAFTLDQFGLLEMKSLCEKTGGMCVTHELFDGQVFRDTFRKVFDKDANGDLRFGFCGDVTIHLSKDLRVAGAIGPCNSLKKASPLVGDAEIGQGGTVQWYLGGLDKNTTLAFYLDLPATQKEKESPQQNNGYIQFVTKYRHSSGKYRLRVTTVTRRFGNAADTNLRELVAGFDQEAACLLVSRIAASKAESEEPIEVIRWLDRTLIRLAGRFGEFRKDDAQSFRMPKEFALFPQFMYHLRRSNFIQITGTSPDESVYFRAALCRENTTNCLVMIQPSLLSYSFDNPEPTPVLLDITSMQDKVILLLDTYFDIVIWKGELIHKWEKAGYQDQAEYENFKQLLQVPMDDANLIIEDRYPAPTFFLTYPGHTKERKVKSRVNPSGVELDNATCQSGDFINDDASLQMFMSHLIKLVVTTPS
jgi:protein transport protein SEC23